jgi:hypothetical protein
MRTSNLEKRMTCLGISFPLQKDRNFFIKAVNIEETLEFKDPEIRTAEPSFYSH